MSFSDIVTYPFAMLLLWLYNITVNYGVAIILFAIVLKFIFLPFQAKSKFSMMRMSRLTPYMKELEKKHQGNQQKYQEEVARLYREEHVNPMSGCLWNLVPIVVLFMLYRVIRLPLSNMMRLTTDQVHTVTDKLVSLGLYTVPAKQDAYVEITLANLVHKNADKLGDLFQSIPRLVDINFQFLGLNLGQRPQWNFFSSVDWSQTSSWLPAFGLFLIPVVSGLLSYFSMKVSMATNPQGSTDPQQQASMKSMMLMMPLMSLWIGFSMPAAISIYWIAQAVFGAVQDYFLTKHYRKVYDEEDAVKQEIAAKRRAEEAEKERQRALRREQNPDGITDNVSKKKIRQQEKEAAEKAAKAYEARKNPVQESEEKKPLSGDPERPYSRGRAYDPAHYGRKRPAGSDAEQTEE